MAIIRLNPIFESIHGKAGPIVFVRRNGTQFVRPYVIPYDPKTELQLKNRNAFAYFVASWQKLPQNSKDSWNRYGKTKNMTGYNLFISENMKSLQRGKGLEPVKIMDLIYNKSYDERTIEPFSKYLLSMQSQSKGYLLLQRSKDFLYIENVAFAKRE